MPLAAPYPIIILLLFVAPVRSPIAKDLLVIFISNTLVSAGVPLRFTSVRATNLEVFNRVLSENIMPEAPITVSVFSFSKTDLSAGYVINTTPLPPRLILLPEFELDNTVVLSRLFEP